MVSLNTLADGAEGRLVHLGGERVVVLGWDT